MQYRRKGWTTPGSNFIWSLDAYDKLLPYGFEIYTGINAYLRYLTWFYVGISAHTLWNVLTQYMKVVIERQTMPYIIRSDRGVETTLYVAAHFYLIGRRKKV